MDGEITLISLATTAGAAVAAGLIVQFTSAAFTLTAKAKRLLSLFSGAGLVVLATLLTAEITIPIVVVAVFNGFTAGLAASQGYQTIGMGLEAKVTTPAGETS